MGPPPSPAGAAPALRELVIQLVLLREVQPEDRVEAVQHAAEVVGGRDLPDAYSIAKPPRGR